MVNENLASAFTYWRSVNTDLNGESAVVALALARKDLDAGKLRYGKRSPLTYNPKGDKRTPLD
jgi:hypothetical protein